MDATIISALGGRAAEELVFNKVGTGAASDFQVATGLARKMVTAYGMSEALGPVIYSQREGDYMYSQKTAEMIDAEVRSIIERCYIQAKKLLEQNRDKLDKLAEALLEKETMYAGEVYELLSIKPREEFKLS
jgi:cell division protease FtsH